MSGNESFLLHLGHYWENKCGGCVWEGKLPLKEEMFFLRSADWEDNQSQVAKLQQQLITIYYSSKRVSEQKYRRGNTHTTQSKTNNSLFPFHHFLSSQTETVAKHAHIHALLLWLLYRDFLSFPLCALKRSVRRCSKWHAERGRVSFMDSSSGLSFACISKLWFFFLSLSLTHFVSFALTLSALLSPFSLSPLDL